MEVTEERAFIINKTIEFVKKSLKGAESGHDWWHIERVWKLAKTIGEKENADMFVIELAALLHDIADPKFHDNNEPKAPELISNLLGGMGLDETTIRKVIDIVSSISFKDNLNQLEKGSLEQQIVQDADRLDAIGAIGIARTFNYGGFKNRDIYNPAVKPANYKTKQEYLGSRAPTINHFYEKLLLLKDQMNTATAKNLAEARHEFMLEYLDRFFEEWNGRK